MIKYNLLNGVALAYIGDAYYELMIRNHLLEKGITKVNDLHKIATKYVSATSQAKVIDELLKSATLSSEEEDIVKRGRNAKINHKHKSVDILTYKHSTSFEALIGYLYLQNNFERLNTLIAQIINIIESW